MTTIRLHGAFATGSDMSPISSCDFGCAGIPGPSGDQHIHNTNKTALPGAQIHDCCHDDNSAVIGANAGDLG